jgi:uncharacterized protein (DUF4415 family)
MKKSKRSSKRKIADDVDDTLPDDFWEKCEPGHIFLPKLLGKKNAKLLMEGKVGRPVAVNPAPRTSIRLAPDVDAYFRATGKGWQTRINKALREWIAQHD